MGTLAITHETDNFNNLSFRPETRTRDEIGINHSNESDATATDNQLQDKVEEDELNADSTETYQSDSTRNDNTDAFHPALTRSTLVGTYAQLIIVCLIMIFLFSAYISFESLQSSLNEKEGLGTTGVALFYVSMIITGLFLSPMTLSYLSHKWVMVLFITTYVLYLMTGFHGTWVTIVPTCILGGMGAAHLWLAVIEYVTELARRYAVLTGKTPKDGIGVFFGIFFGSFLASYIFGNLAASVILEQTGSNISNTSDSVCGADFCPVGRTDGQSTFTLPPQHQIFTYVGVCVGLACVAMLMSSLLLIKMAPSKHNQHQKFYMVSLNVIKHIIRSRDQKILAFPCFMRGIHIGLTKADFTIAFVSCPHGVENVGYIMAVYGGAAAVFSILFGRLWRKTGSLPLFSIGCFSQIAMVIIMLLWQPQGSSIAYVYAISVGLCIMEIVLTTLLSGIHSSHFKDTGASTSCFNLITALGMATSYSISSFLCMRSKLYINMAFSVISFGCTTVYITLKRREKTVPKDTA